MKQLLETIWNFVRKIPKGITKYIQHKKRLKSKEDVSEIQEKADSNKQKYKRKRKSFNSFVHQEQQQMQAKRKKTSSRRLKRRKQANTDEVNSFSKISYCNENQQVDGSQKMNLNDNYFNRICSQPECEAIFQDTNGMQISMINQGKANDDPSCKESDSEVQLIKLISGDKVDDNASLLTRKLEEIKFQEAFKKKQKLEWWQKIVEGKRPPFSSIKKQRESLQLISQKQSSSLVISLSNIKISNTFKNKKQTSNFKQKDRPNIIKVLNLIDLVQNEDFPKLYQIPLSVKVYDQ